VTEFKTVVCLVIISVCIVSSMPAEFIPVVVVFVLVLVFQKESLERGKKFKESIT
jgi:F0F1-type ATP synthase assembly protein I